MSTAMVGTVARRRWLAPEVVQTSAMDCGPAALKCVLEGYGIAVSYGRLREACQTGVDGTSIDTLEQVSLPLGVQAEQVMIPIDHLLQHDASALPAIVVVRQADGATHFVVVWRRVGSWLQVMDPATGRRWVRARAFADEVYHHEMSVAEADWRAWAASAPFLAPLRERLARLGMSGATAETLINEALADAGWFSFGALDAGTRLVQALVRARGIDAGAPAARLLRTLVERSRASTDDIFSVVPAAYWSATPDPHSETIGALHLTLRGAVLVRVPGRNVAAVSDGPEAAMPLSRELQAALQEKPAHPLQAAWALLRAEGLLAPLALAAAMGVAAGALVIEALLLRGVFDITAQLALPGQRLIALGALVMFAALLLSLEVPIVAESLRMGRHLEMRLRMALLAKLPRLGDRYFQSRSVSDMAERSHSLQATRQMPSLGLNFLQSLAELGLTLLGVALIAPASTGLAAAIVATALLLPLMFQPLMGERDLRLRNHASALNGCYLDALLGLVPVRTHRAEQAVRGLHEALLVEWARSSRGMAVVALAAQGVQALVCMCLAAWLMISHFARAGAVNGSDLLLVYWVLKLPALGSGLAALARQVPGQRNVLMRLLEPLAAPEDRSAASASLPRQTPAAGAVLDIAQGSVLAAGHEILRDIDLHIGAGEHVAIVGASGAGKSSLVGLLLGWHRLASGSVSVDGHALDDDGLEALRRDTAWVDPAVQIWNSTLLDNLACAGDDDGLARVGAVIDAAGLRGVLQKLPQGLQTRLGEGGALLSGGEGQRVRLGRAFMQRGVRLALLDEPFRGLDRTQRSALLADARRWWHGATLLCVTHDVGETQAFDRVLVVADGRVVEDGAPHVLAARASHYAALLQAERDVREQLWQGPGWRRIHIEGGRIAAGSGALSS